MPDIAIVTQTFEPSPTAGRMRVNDQAFPNGGSVDSVIGWTAEFAFDDAVPVINSKIIDAVIAEFARVDPPITVRPNDKKILFCAAT